MDSLKDKNKLSLAGLMGAPLLIILVLQVGLEGTKTALDFLVAAGLATVASGVLVMLSDSLPQSIKHKLVFLRLRHELPGHRCDKLCFSDSRLEKDELLNNWPHVFGEEASIAARNMLWYKHIYKPVMSEPPVQSSHQKFLLYRDAAAGSLLILILLAIWTFGGFNAPHLGTLHPWAIAIEAVFLLIMMVSSKNYGKRMVINATVVRAYGQQD